MITNQNWKNVMILINTCLLIYMSINIVNLRTIWTPITTIRKQIFIYSYSTKQSTESCISFQTCNKHFRTFPPLVFMGSFRVSLHATSKRHIWCSSNLHYVCKGKSYRTNNGGSRHVFMAYVVPQNYNPFSINWIFALAPYAFIWNLFEQLVVDTISAHDCTISNQILFRARYLSIQTN